jgi:hypothetical protein
MAKEYFRKGVTKITVHRLQICDAWVGKWAADFRRRVGR